MAYINKINKDGDIYYIIGALPGLNQTIDKTGHFERTLLSNINFIDLIPITYDIKAISKIIDASVEAAKYIVGYENAKKPEAIKKKYKDIDLSNLYTYTSKNNNITNKFFSLALSKYLKDNTINYTKKNIVRLIASNDSVFSENLQNQFGDNDFLQQISENPLIGGMHALMDKAKKFTNDAVKSATGIDTLGTIKNLPKYSYGQALTQLSKFSTSGKTGSLEAIMAKEFLGMNIALPRIFNESSYTNSLNVFIKLTSPTGTNVDIEKYILNPLKILILAAAPFSFDGLTTYIPPVWGIKSYGNTEIKAGVIDVLTVTRGSLDTTYNDYLQPLSLDVRITISNLADRFANVFATNIKQESDNVGMVTPISYDSSFSKTKGITDIKINL